MRHLFLISISLVPICLFGQTYTTTRQGQNFGYGGAYVPPAVTKNYTVKQFVKQPVYTAPLRSSSNNATNTSSSVNSVENSGSKSSSSGRYKPAAKSVTPATAADYHYLGTTKYSYSEYEAAIAYYQKAVELDPLAVQSHLFIGLSKYQLKDYAGSIPHFNKAIQLEPTHEIAFINRANSKLMIADFKGAIEDYSRSIELYGSQYASTYYSRGIARYNIKDYSGAVEDYSKTITLCDETQKAYDEELQKEYAWIKNSKARNEAIKKSGRAIEREPMYAGSFSERGLAKMQLSDVQGALKDFNRSIEINPKITENYYFRGIINLTIPGNKDAGCLDLNKALELGYAAANDLLKKYCQ